MRFRIFDTAQTANFNLFNTLHTLEGKIPGVG